VVKCELVETQRLLAGVEVKDHQETVEKEKLLMYVASAYRPQIPI